MARVDLTVRGAGIFGLSVAWAAARRGARVRVIESVRVGAGASGGVVGALAPHVPEQWNAKKAFQLDSLLMASGWWAGVEAVSGLVSGYGRTGRLQPLADARAVEQARQRQSEAAVLWRGMADWRVVAASGAEWEPAAASGWLVQDTLTARVNPRLALAALVGAIRSQGGEVIVGDAPDQGAVVWATGVAGLVDLSAALGGAAGVGVKGQALVLAHDAGAAPQLFVDGLHIVPHGDGTVAVGSTSENRWVVADSTDDQLDALHQRAVAALPVLRGAGVVERWAGLRPRAASRAPVLGPFPGREGHFIANSGFKIGFGMAPKIAEVMADLVLDGRDAIPDDFRVAALRVRPA
jgi:glycine/D-amino acid oxidase-like deaminating enzyme